MSIFFKTSIFICLVLSNGSCQVDQTAEVMAKSPAICGLTCVAPPLPFDKSPMHAMKNIHCNWVAVVPYAFTPRDEARVYFDHKRQWWGERTEGVIVTIDSAKNAGLKVMLKPQVWSRGYWTGDYHFETSQEWDQWEADYSQYILNFARLADSLQVDLFCMGTEFKNAVKRRPHYWTSLIDSIKQIYHGPLTYAANWDNYQNIPFWQKLDYIGINAYFPLLHDKTPSVSQLIRAWKKPKATIESFASKKNLPVIFTEYGYLSVDGATHNTWELEGKLDRLAANETSQANAIDALHQTFITEAYWQGGFLWKWYPDLGRQRNRSKDYTPQNKLAQSVLKKWFSQ